MRTPTPKVGLSGNHKNNSSVSKNMNENQNSYELLKSLSKANISIESFIQFDHFRDWGNKVIELLQFNKKLQKRFIDKHNRIKSLSQLGYRDQQLVELFTIIDHALLLMSENIPGHKADNKATNPSKRKDNWQNSIPKYIAVGVAITIITFCILYLVKENFGLSL